jgi:hypothetical protein
MRDYKNLPVKGKTRARYDRLKEGSVTHDIFIMALLLNWEQRSEFERQSWLAQAYTTILSREKETNE